MMIFRTLNSVYELHDTDQKVRRVEGKNPPIHPFVDGKWLDYTEIFALGSRTTFYFPDGSAVTTSTVTDWDGASS